MHYTLYMYYMQYKHYMNYKHYLHYMPSILQQIDTDSRPLIFSNLNFMQ